VRLRSSSTTASSAVSAWIPGPTGGRNRDRPCARPSPGSATCGATSISTRNRASPCCCLATEARAAIAGRSERRGQRVGGGPGFVAELAAGLAVVEDHRQASEPHLVEVEQLRLAA